MIKNIFIRKRSLLWAAAAVLIAVLVITSTAFAEGEEPPPAEPAPAEEAPAAEESAAPVPETEEAASAPEEEAPPEEPVEAPVLEEPADEASAEEDDTGAAAAQTGVELVDESGEAMDMASQETSELLASGDPYYTVGSIKYRFYASGGICGGDPHCTDGLGPTVIQYALDSMAANGLPSNRKLYVEGGSYGGFTINGTASPQMAMLNGVIGEDGSKNTNINGSIDISYNTGGFTLSGFTITGGDIFAEFNSGTWNIEDIDVTSPTYHGIRLTDHSGAINIDRLRANNNDDSGAWIDNTAGTNPITIKNSSFNNNGYSTPGDIGGLDIGSKGKVTLEGVTASRNKGSGIRIYTSPAASLKNVYCFDNDSQNTGDTTGHGLQITITGSGTASLENVYTGGNEQGGIWATGGNLRAKYVEASGNTNGHGMYFFSDPGSSRVEFGVFNNNNDDGLRIENTGDIYLNSIHAADNGRHGVYLDNYNGGGMFTGSGSVTMTSPTSGGSLQSNQLVNNHGYGLQIRSMGSVTLYNFDVVNNGDGGIIIQNDFGTGSVTVKKNLPQWYNSSRENIGYGLNIHSGGAVSISDTSFYDNQLTGLRVETLKTIQLTRVRGMNNFGSGAYLDNSSAPRAYSVTLADCAFNGNGDDGLILHSMGSISAKGLSASGNSLRQLWLGPSLSYYASVEDLIWENWMDDVYSFYGTNGEWVDLDVESSDFDTYIVLYDSSWTFVTDSAGGSHSHLGLNLPTHPTDPGDTYHAVVHSYNYEGTGRYTFALNDLAHNNYLYVGAHGAQINNGYGTGGVTISHGSKSYKDEFWGNFFDANKGMGLWIYSYGTVSVDGASASDNFEQGVFIDNVDSRASVTVKNTRTDDFGSDFGRNGYQGIYIRTMGNITLQHVSAYQNGGSGAVLDNCILAGDCTGFGSVSVLASSNRGNYFDENTSSGLEIDSHGSIKLVNTSASGNGDYGATLDNEKGSSTGSVTVTNAGSSMWNTFNGNVYEGLRIRSYGNVSIKNIEAHENDSDGADIRNSLGTSPRTVSITNGYFSQNDDYGLLVNSLGSITWKNGAAWENGLTGGYLANNLTGATGGIMVSGSSKNQMWFNDNGQDTGGSGLVAFSHGKITISYADAHGNIGGGLYLSNIDAATDLPVTVSDVNLDRNSNGRGLYVESKGTITVKGITSNNNAHEGAWLGNASGSGNIVVTTTGRTSSNELRWNGQSGSYSGLKIQTAGSVTIKNTGAAGNGYHGIWVDNTYGTGSVIFSTTNQSYWMGDNGFSGMYIQSNGAVSVNNKYTIWANGNQNGYGLYITNTTAPTPQNVTIDGVESSENTSSGIEVYTMGTITASDLVAFSNGDRGVRLQASGTGKVTVSGVNHVENNANHGLSILAHNTVTVSGLTSQYNKEWGLYISADDADISVKNSTVRGNGSNGLRLITDGDVTIYKVNAFSNGWNFSIPWDTGVYIDAGMDSNITFQYCSIQANFGGGILIEHPNPSFDWDLVNPQTAPYLKLYKTYYYGNGDTDLAVVTI